MAPCTTAAAHLHAQAGTCDGLTYEQVKEQMPHEYQLRKQDKLRYRQVGGSIAAVHVC